MKRSFIDSNLVVYANDCSSGAKQEQAITLIQELMTSQTGVISTQVLQEYAQVATNKLGQDSAVVLRQLRLLENFRIVPLTGKTVRRAVEIQTSYQISFWDANIIAAAEAADCDRILSEDLNAGQLYAGIEVVNPFQA
jgi:predicted nucleic acid-binding protein